MVPNVGVRTYRPRQMGTFQGTRRMKRRISLCLSQTVRRFLAISCLVALVAGLLVTQYFYGQMMEMRAQAEQMRELHAQMTSTHMGLVERQELLSSREHIVAVASVRLDLFEPSKGQVRRM
ncbi:hypothetical protein JWJ90_03260 [Desulfobulbus rhabdoformis]|uniref:hypothetical protein n=1 Tax=Desulfobulbus rhabdoformis TaxID=34032 RepID=UPI001966B603|nr:hypothetical protein [Desulfobulbus rhabdoformis]MBM9613300.1 hypothetical protein [Desulfobulbus rhabdoformis]